MTDLIISSPLMHLQKFRQQVKSGLELQSQEFRDIELAEAFDLDRGKLARFIGPQSKYSNKEQLRTHLVNLCTLLRAQKKDGNEGNVSLIRDKLREGINNCSAGFFNRVQLCFELTPVDANMPALLAALRNETLSRARNQLGIDEIHANERLRVVANDVLNAAIPVHQNTVKDPYHGRYKDNQIVDAVSAAFGEYYTPYRIVEELFQSTFSDFGYRGDLLRSEEFYGDEDGMGFYEKIKAFFQQSLPENVDIQWQDLFLCDDEEACPFDLKWSRIISTTIDWLFKNEYFLRSSLQFTPTSLFNGSSLKIALDEGNIDNTLFAFELDAQCGTSYQPQAPQPPQLDAQCGTSYQPQAPQPPQPPQGHATGGGSKESDSLKVGGGQGLYFFLGNARHFAPDSREILDKSYLLSEEQALQVVRQVKLFPPQLREKILARLLLAGFQVDVEPLVLNSELRELITDEADLLRVLGRLNDGQTAIVLSQLEEQEVLGVINDVSSLSKVLKPLASAQQKLLLENPKMANYTITDAGFNQVFAVLKKDGLSDIVFKPRQDMLLGMANSVTGLSAILKPLSSEQQTILLGALAKDSFHINGDCSTLLKVFGLLQGGDNKACFFEKVKGHIPPLIMSSSDLGQVMGCLDSNQANIIWNVLLSTKRLSKLFGSVNDFEIFSRFLKTKFEDSENKSEQLIQALKEDPHRRGLWSALLKDAPPPPSEKAGILPVSITQQEFDALLLECASLVRVSSFQGLIDQVLANSVFLTPGQCFQIFKLQEAAAVMYAAGFKSESLVALFDTLTPAQKLELLKIQNSDGWTAVMYAAWKKPEGLATIFAGLAPAQKFELLKAENSDGWTAVMLVARSHPAALNTLLTGLTPKQKFELLKTEKSDDWTAVMIAARSHPEALNTLLTGLSTEQRVELLGVQSTSDDWTAVMLAARNHPDALKTMFADLAAEHKFELLKIQKSDGWTAVMFAVTYHPDYLVAIFSEFVDLGAAQKFKLLEIQDNDGWTAVMYAACKKPEGLATIFAGLAPAQKFELLKAENSDGWTAVMLAARNNPEALKTMFADLAAEQKFELLQAKKSDDWTAVMLAARNHPEALKTMFADLAAKQKFELLKTQSNNGLTVVMLAARHQPDTLETLFTDLTLEQKVVLLKIQNSDGQTPVMYAARHQPEALKTLLADLATEQKLELLLRGLENIHIHIQRNIIAPYLLGALLAAPNSYRLTPTVLDVLTANKGLLKQAYGENKHEFSANMAQKVGEENSVFGRVVRKHRSPQGTGNTATLNYFMREARAVQPR